MIKFINSWAQGIIVAVIISTIIEIILPEGNNKKYIKTIMGIYILFCIISPLISKLSNNNINLNSIINSANKEITKYDSNKISSIETNAYIENTYKNKLENDIKSRIKEKGYNVLDLKLYIETEKEEFYGNINSIAINVEKSNIEQNNGISNIEEVEINISNKKIEQVKDNKKVEESEINILKEYLNSIYSIELERIHINE